MKAKNEHYECYFCGSDEIRIPAIKIAFCMGGTTYSFCRKCLDGMSADEFWQELFTSHKYTYPPKLADWAQEAWDTGITLSEARYPPLSNTELLASRSKYSKEEKERRKLSNSLRYLIMKRDNFRCVLCGVTAKNDKLVLDHILPISKGGKTTKENLRTVCEKCNSGKGAKLEK